MTVKRVSMAVAALALVVLLVIGLVGLGSSGGAGATKPLALSAAQMQAQLAGSPQPLAGLHAQASEILGGGLGALRARLRALRGWPVVINKWASWCVPCREEFAVFQRVALARGREVAFVGIDSSDSRASAAAFLRSYPLSYPSYFDASGSMGLAMTDSNFTPVTAFYGRDGQLSFIHQGPYANTQKLERDIERYALDA